MARHIRKGDTVIVTAGNDRGATGEVLHVYPADDRVLVQGVNIRTKHLKPSQNNQGGIVRREMPIHISNVSPVADGKPTRVRFQVKSDGTKVRLAARGGGELHTLRGNSKSTKAKAPKAAAVKSSSKKKSSKSAGKKAKASK